MMFIREVAKIINLTYDFMSPGQFSLGVERLEQKGFGDQAVRVVVPWVKDTGVILEMAT